MDEERLVISDEGSGYTLTVDLRWDDCVRIEIDPDDPTTGVTSMTLAADEVQKLKEFLDALGKRARDFP